MLLGPGYFSAAYLVKTNQMYLIFFVGKGGGIVLMSNTYFQHGELFIFLTVC